MPEGEMLGYQTGAAYVNSGLIIAWKVVSRVSLEWPQLVPANAFIILSLPLVEATTLRRCSANVRWVSKDTPRILGCRQRGSKASSIVTAGSVLDWCVSEVKRVTWDFGRLIDRPRSRAQFSTSPACSDRRAAASRKRGDETMEVKSSA